MIKVLKRLQCVTCSFSDFFFFKSQFKLTFIEHIVFPSGSKSGALRRGNERSVFMMPAEHSAEMSSLSVAGDLHCFLIPREICGGGGDVDFALIWAP